MTCATPWFIRQGYDQIHAEIYHCTTEAAPVILQRRQLCRVCGLCPGFLPRMWNWPLYAPYHRKTSRTWSATCKRTFRTRMHPRATRNRAFSTLERSIWNQSAHHMHTSSVKPRTTPTIQHTYYTSKRNLRSYHPSRSASGGYHIAFGQRWP